MKSVNRFSSQYIEDRSIAIPESGCWLWLKRVNAGGYGVTGGGKTKNILAHRIAWVVYRGPIPDDLYVLHRCDVPSCVNPDHLWLGTQSDNNKDRVSKDRSSHDHGVKGEHHYLAKLTDDAVQAIRQDERLQREIAADYGVAQTLISQVKRRLIWRHIP